MKANQLSARKLTRRVLIGTLLAFSSIAAACGSDSSTSPDSVAVDSTEVVSEAPQKIISLAATHTEILFAVGAGDGDGVLASPEADEGCGAGLGGRQDGNIQASGVVVLQVRLHLLEHLGVVSAVLVEPEYGGIAGGAGAFDGEFYPVLHWCVLGLASAPDVACFDFVGKQDVSCGIHDTHGSAVGDLEGFVV